nr:hypothetical protein [Tanacetum cinerariifolium]
MTEEEDDMGVMTGDEGEDAGESGDILILNSLIGHGSPRSLQLLGKIGKGDFYVLIDNGSTHNFIRLDVFEKMCIPIKSTKAFKVYIGSGESLLCESVCSSVTLHMQRMALQGDQVCSANHDETDNIANQVADALSRMYEDGELVKAEFMDISLPVVRLLEDLKSDNEILEELQALHQQLDTRSRRDGF